MSFKEIIGLNQAKKILQRAIKEHRVSGAYLFWGMEGIGKEALAIEFAKVLNCQNPKFENEEIYACEICKSCHQFHNLSHSNFHFIHALPAGKASDKNDSPLDGLAAEQISQIQEQIKLKSKNYYHKLNITNASQIKISSIRDLKKKLTKSGTNSGMRVVLIANAEEMTTEASNAFLKTLEEPHEKVCIILTTSHKESILQTIISRCQLINCEPINDDDLTKYIIEKYKLEEPKARIIAAFAQGSISKIEEFLDEDIQQVRLDAVDILRTSLKGKKYRVELLEKIDKLIKMKDKGKIEFFLNLLSIWLQDANKLKFASDKNNIVNRDQIDTIQKFADYYKDANITDAILKIQESINLLYRNVNPQLIMITLFNSLRIMILSSRYSNS